MVASLLFLAQNLKLLENKKKYNFYMKTQELINILTNLDPDAIVIGYNQDSHQEFGILGVDLETYKTDNKVIYIDIASASCKNCDVALTADNYDGNGDGICDPCYDDQYSGCCGGGCKKG